MVVNNKEPMEIILLTYIEIESTLTWFHVYRNNREPVIGEVLKTCMEPQNEVFDNENNDIGHLKTVKNMRQGYFIFWKLIP